MKRVIITAMAVICILSCFSTMAYSYNEKTIEDTQQTRFSELRFSSLRTSQETNDYLSVEIDGIYTYLMSPGQPVLPKVVHVVELPFGARNVDVKVTMDDINEQQVTQEIRPASYLLPLSKSTNVANYQIKDMTIYGSDNPYPSEWFSYTLRSGLNAENKRVTFAIIHLYPVRYIPNSGTIIQAETSDIKVTYEMSPHIQNTINDPYDLVIIAPRLFRRHLTRLVNHKNEVGVKSFLITTEEIYSTYDGIDKPEQIKYFIKDAIETHNITYVLLIGGLKNQILARPRDDANQGSKGWYVPVRYANLYDKPKFPLDENPYANIFDPGAISDLYYADIYDAEGNFSCWDPNGDGIFAAWGIEGVEDDEGIDLIPDVSIGRLACRSIREVQTVVNKIITYETSNIANSEWFNRILMISGDGFLDQQDWNLQWDTTGLKNGEYTIYAQSFNKEGEESYVETISIEIDRTKKTTLTFKHTDHLNPALADGYPAPPVVEIVTVSPGDILGYTDFTYTPTDNEAYCNYFLPWANMSYVNGVLTIRGKSYDPKPYGNLTDIHVWIKDGKYGEIIFSEWINDSEMYYEGEWTQGEKVLFGRGGATYYMPEKFERDILWASNGRITNVYDVLNAWNKGSGFAFLSGHGSANVWGDHFPGVPGNRQHGSFTGLSVTNLKPWPPFYSLPIMPIDTMSNAEKLPIAVIGGCHNSQFNVSILPAMYDLLPNYFPNLLPKITMWTYGQPVPQCFNWRLVRNPNGGSIASIGNAGFGYGMPGKDLTTGGGDGWITIEFFRQYGEHEQKILGNAHSQAIKTYVQTHDMTDFEAGHAKTVQQWTLLGDPSLQIGGYIPTPPS
ncbi:MAG: C25 family cysteine peptidase [Thermoplasmatota archaeon]